jgi:hypothetical protein
MKEELNKDTKAKKSWNCPELYVLNFKKTEGGGNPTVTEGTVYSTSPTGSL